jgi:transcriptional regulator with GAF, ATPase, and Fis domain
MSSIPQVSLEDTYTLMQLVRETALAKGRTEQADQLTPVVNEMRSVVSSARTTSSVPASTGVLGQADFKQLLEISQEKVNAAEANQNSVSITERNRLVKAMASAEMSSLDIARQMGMSREEVDMVVNSSPKTIYPSAFGDYQV